MKTFKGITNIRFYSILSILFLHAKPIINDTVIPDFDLFIINLVLELRSFAVFSFFMASGFLLYDSIWAKSSKDILLRKWKTIFKPFLVVVVLHVIVYFGYKYFLFEKGFNEIPFVFQGNIDYVFKSFVYTLLNFHYWFITAYFFSLVFLIFLEKYFSKFTPYVVLLVFFIPLILQLNVEYNRLFQAPGAIYAGLLLRKHYGAILSFKRNYLFIAMVASYILMILFKSELIYFPLVTLISRFFYAAIIVCIFIQRNEYLFPKQIDPDNETYIVFLYHGLILIVMNWILPKLVGIHSGLYGLLDKPEHIMHWNISAFFIVWLVKFLILTGLSIIFSKIILHYKLHFLTGK